MNNILKIIAVVAVIVAIYFVVMGDKETKVSNGDLTVKKEVSNMVEKKENDSVIKKESNIITGKEGLSLYTFKNDTENTSNCNGDCAVKWPPVKTIDEINMGDKKNFSILTRSDKTEQVAYNGKPLYYWFKDMKAGDTTGDGIKGVWDLAKID